MTDQGANKTIYLGWDGPLLPRACDWLLKQYGQAGADLPESRAVCDLQQVIAVVPGARAGRRLQELLAAPDRIVIPPTIITAGQLDPLLCPEISDSQSSESAPQPLRVADELTSLLARMHVLQSISAHDLQAVIPHLPETGDLSAWLALASELEQLHKTLGSGNTTIADVIATCDQLSDFNDHKRWAVLQDVHLRTQALLHDQGFIDQSEAAHQAIQSSTCSTDRAIVLIGTTDLNEVTKQMLQQVQNRVTVLIHAPADEREGFDELGCVAPGYWQNKYIPIREEQIHLANELSDQALQVLRTMAGNDGQNANHQQLNSQYTRDQVTVGLADERAAGLMERTLESAGVPTHTAIGLPISKTRPAMLLAAIADFADQQRIDAFAALLRHPDIETFVHTKLAQQLSEETADSTANATSHSTGKAIDHWLTLLDDYITTRLGGKTPQTWLGDDADAARLKEVRDAITTLLPDHCAQNPNARQSLPKWAPAITHVLREVFNASTHQGQLPVYSHLARSIQIIRDGIEVLGTLNAPAPSADNDPNEITSIPWLPDVTFAQAVRILLHHIEGQTIPSEPIETDPSQSDANQTQGQAQKHDTAPIELLGWLELQHDDAPALIVTGFSEHQVPQSMGPDAFLPEQLQALLPLPDNRQRYARDAAALSAILNSRPFVALIASRKGSDGEPVPPSRLLLTGDANEQANRLLRFYPDDPAQTQQLDEAMPAFLTAGGDTQFLIPAPMPPAAPLTKLRATAFRDYLACPYRFYLKHIKRLQARDDRAFEIDGGRFGTLAHQVLRRFGISELRSSIDHREISSYLIEQLNDIATQHYADQPPAVARVQLRMLEQRFVAFAQWQVEQVTQGWQVLTQSIEHSFSVTLNVDDQPFKITGQIDRVDQHEDGRIRIIDYKTADAGQTPKATHLSKGEWIDLQLPLYRAMWLAQTEITTPIAATDIELGYTLLPKDLSLVDFQDAQWDQDLLNTAIETAHDVIRNIRAGMYWPPRENWKYSDEFSDLCMERHDQWRHMRSLSSDRSKESQQATTIASSSSNVIAQEQSPFLDDEIGGSFNAE